MSNESGEGDIALVLADNILKTLKMSHNIITREQKRKIPMIVE
jgi:hypothetical protein